MSRLRSCTGSAIARRAGSCSDALAGARWEDWKEDDMADPPVTKKDLDALSKKVDALQKQLDGLQKWAETSTTTINKAVEDIDKNVDQVAKDLKATSDWATQNFNNLAKVLNSK
jgi:hypothetical protein